jgi:hypothetical protein
MSLVRNDKPGQNKKPRKLLSRGAKLIVESNVDRPGPTATAPSTLTTPTVTKAKAPKPYPANVRVDSHIRNQINALLNLGLADSARDLLETLVQMEIERLNQDELKRYTDMLDILEAKGAMKQRK